MASPRIAFAELSTVRAQAVTFSGLDGAGKTTLIAELKTALESTGLTVRRVSMYENVGLYSAVRRLRRRRRRLGADESPPPAFRSTTAQRVIHGTLLTKLLLPVDLALFLLQWRRLRATADVVIFDRYFYDSVIELHAEVRGWGSAVLACVPRPAVSVFVDVEPAVAFARKGEHTVAELARRDQAYRLLFGRLSHGVTVRNDSLEAANRAILSAVMSTTSRVP